MESNGHDPHATGTTRGIEDASARSLHLIGLWAIGALLTLGAATLASPWLAIVVAAAGAGVIAMRLRRPLVVVPAALALVPAVLGGAAVGVLWLAAAALLAFASAQSRRVVRVEMNELQRHLSWTRRRGEQASVLLVQLPAAAIDDSERALVASFRITDSVALHRRSGGYELEAVLDHEGLDRLALERRIRETAGSSVAVGWATFPEDGVALSVLLEAARERLSHTPIPADVVRLPQRAQTPRPTTAPDRAAAKGV
ncbi:MAG: hypothetical protein JSS99_00925 [Actinobacteria bacterium]|nr:hypothetical protein [Actinomycetota bacterium]